MKNEAKIFAKAFISALAGKDESGQRQIVQNFLEVVARKKKIYLLPRILKELELIEKGSEAVLVLARDLDQGAVEEIKEGLKKRLGRDKKFKVEIDQSIIGGFKARTSNLLIDSSIKTIIENIRKKLV
ncbi:MAG: F0F1 ATP synthase subunit delta [Candidatus Paceibacterota bacterium]|jgi:F0F1-type ATP synthase delta subunit